MDQALEFCRRVQPFDVRWFEEPVQWFDQYQGLHLVQSRGGIPGCRGTRRISRFACRDLMLARAADILNVDATIAGGVTEWRRIAAMAGMFNVLMAHHEEPQVALHLLASIPHGLFVEIFHNSERDPIWFELPEKQPRIEDGYMYIGDLLGFGMPLRQEFIEQYRAEARICGTLDGIREIF